MCTLPHCPFMRAPVLLLRDYSPLHLTQTCIDRTGMRLTQTAAQQRCSLSASRCRSCCIACSTSRARPRIQLCSITRFRSQRSGDLQSARCSNYTARRWPYIPELFSPARFPLDLHRLVHSSGRRLPAYACPKVHVHLIPLSGPTIHSSDSGTVQPLHSPWPGIMTSGDLSFSRLCSAYTDGSLTPSSVILDLFAKLPAIEGAFVSLTTETDLRKRCRELETYPAADRPPLWGIPFAVKDNVDVAGYQTTAACKDFAYTPETSAAAVQALINAGAVLFGKTNMDQFAAGLVGTRTPYGVAPNAFDDRFIPGGSSSGSGVAVGAGLVSFALGTDTAGSGRIPAGLNGCVGLKASVGRVTTDGVVPACASLDCLTCFATNVSDAAVVVQIMQEAGQLEDPLWRLPDLSILNQHYMGGGFTFGVPNPQFLDFSGPGGSALETKYQELFQEAVKSLQRQGGQQVDIDFTPFAATAKLLYESAFVAERYSGIRGFLDKSQSVTPTAEEVRTDPRLEKVLGAILSGAPRFSATDVYDDNVKLRQLKGKARVEMAKVDLLLVPTALHHYTVQEIYHEERKNDKVTWTRNAKLGRFTNFVNLLDMCAVSVPSAVYKHPQITGGLLGNLRLSEEVVARQEHLQQTGLTEPQLPFGVTLISTAWRDNWLCEIASRLHEASRLGCGPAGHCVTPYRQTSTGDNHSN